MYASVPAIISGGAGAWCSRGSREAMPNPVSHTRPLAASTRTLAGLMSLWIRPRSCTWRSAPFVFEPVDVTGRDFFCGNKQDWRQAGAGPAVESNVAAPQRRDYVARATL